MSVPAWSDAVTAALIFSLDPAGTGILLRSRAGPVRDRWISIAKAAVPALQPLRHLPAQTDENRLLGGLDLDATLRLGKPVAEHGLLTQADGGVLIVGTAERLPASTATYLAAALDNRAVRLERDGMSLLAPARFGIIACDEGVEDEAAPAALVDRLAMHLDFETIAWGDTDMPASDAMDLDAARTGLRSIQSSEEDIARLCNAAAALGISSLRAPMYALSVARCAAALAGHEAVDADDLACAARLVLAPRATIVPQAQTDAAEPPPPADPKDGEGDVQHADLDRAMDDVVLAAAQAAIPANLLASLRAGVLRQRGRGAGQAGALQKSASRGRPTGTRRGELKSGAKLNVIATLRMAAPWQALRRKASDNIARVIVRPEDVRVTRFRQRSETATIFVVDASGSAALHRLAEAKGAVELLLADCYVRRDQVALIAFRGTQSELLLPPTRSLTRAKRSLAGLPGGGGTPLAAGLDAAFNLADAVKRKGQTPSVVLLTDGRANVARDGSPGRPRAEQDATLAARRLRAAGIAAILVDTSARPGPAGAQLAADMNARYLPLPYADAAALSKAVKAAIG